jgi:MFS family permease
VSDLAEAPAQLLARISRAATRRTPRVAVTAVFFVNGLLFASWTAHIPPVKQHLGLADGPLGIALLGAPAGSVLAMLLTARLLPRIGSKRMVRATLVGYCIAGPVVGLTGSLAALFAALMLWGAFQGTLDVSMNTQAISVERQAQRTLMPGFHAWWSLGTFAGAAVGALGVAVGLSLTDQLVLLGAPCLVAGGWLAVAMIADEPSATDELPAASEQAQLAESAAAEPAEPDPPSARRPTAGQRTARVTIAVLGGIALADMLCEGAAADWGAVYLHTSLGAVVGIAALGYASYSLAMVGVRLAGNRLLTRFAVPSLLPFLAGIATVLLGAGLLVNDTATMLVGFFGLGVGLGVVIPAVFSAAGRIPGMNAGTAVAMVSACGWIGFVCGPPLIGQIAGATSLRLALVLLPVMTALIAVSTATCRALR